MYFTVGCNKTRYLVNFKNKIAVDNHHRVILFFKYYLLVLRDRAAADGKAAESSRSDQRNYPFRFNVQIQRDPSLNSHGLTLTSQIPILVQEVTPGIHSHTLTPLDLLFVKPVAHSSLKSCV